MDSNDPVLLGRSRGLYFSVMLSKRLRAIFSWEIRLPRNFRYALKSDRESLFSFDGRGNEKRTPSVMKLKTLGKLI